MDMTFKTHHSNIKYFADHISWLGSMDPYEVLDPEEGGNKFRNFMFDELPPNSAEQVCTTVCEALSSASNN